MRIVLTASALALIAWSGASAQSTGWRIDRADVRVVCPMTVGGSFEAKTSSLTVVAPLRSGNSAGDPPEFSVDLKSLDTGIDLRNEHMRGTYLEVDKGDGFDRAVVSDLRLRAGSLGSVEGRTDFTATLRLHGVSKMIVGQATIRKGSGGVQVEAHFPVKLADFGIPKPTYLGIGVKEQVQVNVSFAAQPATDPAVGSK